MKKVLFGQRTSHDLTPHRTLFLFLLKGILGRNDGSAGMNPVTPERSETLGSEDVDMSLGVIHTSPRTVTQLKKEKKKKEPTTSWERTEQERFGQPSVDRQGTHHSVSMQWYFLKTHLWLSGIGCSRKGNKCSALLSVTIYFINQPSLLTEYARPFFSGS